VSFGAELQHRYDRAARADTSEMRESLSRIEKRLRKGASTSSANGEKSENKQ
jgi:hypothetical protein